MIFGGAVIFGGALLLGRAVRNGAHRAQGGPAKVDLIVPMTRFDIGEPDPAFGAQARAVVPAYRRERQREHHRVTNQRLEVDVVVDQSPDLVVGVSIAALFAQSGWGVLREAITAMRVPTAGRPVGS